MNKGEQVSNMEMVAETQEQAGVQQTRDLTNQRANRNVQDSPEKGQRELNQGGAGRTVREVKEDQGIRKKSKAKQANTDGERY